MLYLLRRHVQECPHASKGRNHRKCDCPIHCDGIHAGARIRQSMDTTNWQRAERRLSKLVDRLDGGRPMKKLPGAVDVFLDFKKQSTGAVSTIRKYTRIMEGFQAYCKQAGCETVEEITLEHLDEYRIGRDVSALTWSKELELLRGFFRFCLKRKWCDENPAREMEMPKKLQLRKRIPFTQAEIFAVFASIDLIGQSAYERLRLRAMVCLLRFYGLRVSDVALFRWDWINEAKAEILLHAKKNKRAVWLPMVPDVRAALAVLPTPEGARDGCPYLFWSERGDEENHIKQVGRILSRLMQRSAVEDATSHRFRHTVAQDILVSGGSLEDVARILGDDPATIEKHYTHLSPAYQHRLSEVLLKAHSGRIDTAVSRGERGFLNPMYSPDSLVPGVGLEPTR